MWWMWKRRSKGGEEGEGDKQGKGGDGMMQKERC